MVVQEEVEVLKVLFSLRPLHPASSATSYTYFLLLVVVSLIHSSCLDGVVFLGSRF